MIDIQEARTNVIHSSMSHTNKRINNRNRKQLFKTINCQMFGFPKQNNITILPSPMFQCINSRYSYIFNPSGPTSANPNAFCEHNFCITLFTFVFQLENSMLSAARSDVDSNCHTVETTSVAGNCSLLRFSSEISVNE